MASDMEFTPEQLTAIRDYSSAEIRESQLAGQALRLLRERDEAEEARESLAARVEELRAVVRAADGMRAFRLPAHPSDLRNAAVKDEWTKLATAYDAARSAVRLEGEK